MELKQLRMFVAVAEELHFGRAADRMHITQPSLSAHIRALEDDLGVQLLYRTTRAVSLTSAGEAFLPQARSTLASAATAVATARGSSNTSEEFIKLGCIDSVTADLLPDSILKFRKHYPNVQFRLTEMLSGQAIQSMYRRTIDLAFTQVPIDNDVFSSKRVMAEHLFVAVNSQHPLAMETDPSLSSIATEPMIISARSHRPVIFDRVYEYLRSHGLEPNVLQEVKETQTSMAMISAGLGLAVVPEWVKLRGQEGVSFFPFPGEPPQIETHLIWRTEDANAIIQTFVDQFPHVALS
ncbi:MAG: LysR family transcriptional regulator [Gammaproteobacteria bacterium]|nr:LysR family transcriptional regulator [Gammaproteobacteria bacterium]